MHPATSRQPRKPNTLNFNLKNIRARPSEEPPTQRKISYALFEKIILEFLSSSDWKAIAPDGSGGASTPLFAKQESLAREIDNTAKILGRYEALIDDPNSDEFERISDKYKAAVAKSKRLLEERTTLETQIASENSGSRLLLETKGIDIFRVGRTSKEDRMKLRLLPHPADSTHRSDLRRYGSHRWPG